MNGKNSRLLAIQRFSLINFCDIFSSGTFLVCTKNHLSPLSSANRPVLDDARYVTAYSLRIAKNGVPGMLPCRHARHNEFMPDISSLESAAGSADALGSGPSDPKIWFTRAISSGSDVLNMRR